MNCPIVDLRSIHTCSLSWNMSAFLSLLQVNENWSKPVDLWLWSHCCSIHYHWPTVFSHRRIVVLNPFCGVYLFNIKNFTSIFSAFMIICMLVGRFVCVTKTKETRITKNRTEWKRRMKINTHTLTCIRAWSPL